MTFEAGKTYDVDGPGDPVLVAYVFPNGRLLCVRGDEHWRAFATGAAINMPEHYDLIAPKPEPRRVYITVRTPTNGAGESLECLIGPDGALRVV